MASAPVATPSWHSVAAFFKIDNARREDNSGFGLGLSIAQEIIKRHGGGIEMRPAEPTGLRVLMELPSETSLHTI